VYFQATRLWEWVSDFLAFRFRRRIPIPVQELQVVHSHFRGVPVGKKIEIGISVSGAG